MSSFAWQSNKAILFYFTQNYISEIWFGTSAEAGLWALERGAVLSRWLISPGPPFPSLASSFSGLCWPLAGLLLNVCAELFISDLIYPQSARDARKFPRPSTNGAIRKRVYVRTYFRPHFCLFGLERALILHFISFLSLPSALLSCSLHCHEQFWKLWKQMDVPPSLSLQFCMWSVWYLWTAFSYQPQNFT